MPQEPEPPWRATARRKRAQQEAAIPPEWRLKPNTRPAPDRTNILDVPRECGILTVEEIRITESYDACGLLEELRRGRLKAVDVARAFCKRAAVAQQLVSSAILSCLFSKRLAILQTGRRDVNNCGCMLSALLLAEIPPDAPFLTFSTSQTA